MQYLQRYGFILWMIVIVLIAMYGYLENNAAWIVTMMAVVVISIVIKIILNLRSKH